MVDTFSTLTIEDKVAYFERDMLIRAKPSLFLLKAGFKTKLPRRSGRFVNWRRMNQIATATTPLTEGLTPAPANIPLSEITGQAQQYGNYVSISDLIDMMALDDIQRESSVMLGENAGQTTEEIIRTELLNGTNVIFPTSTITARNQISQANVLTLSQVRRAVKILLNANARPLQGSNNAENGTPGGLWMGYIHPYVWGDLIADPTVTNMAQYKESQIIYDYTLPKLGGVTWFVSTKAPVFAGAGTTTAVNVYATFVFGLQAYGIVDVAGTSAAAPQVIMKGFGSAGTADALDQRMTQGYKMLQLPKILNNSFMVRLESASNETAA